MKNNNISDSAIAIGVAILMAIPSISVGSQNIIRVQAPVTHYSASSETEGTPELPISLVLEDANLPDGMLGKNYAYDFSRLIKWTNIPDGESPPSLVWAAENSLPAGLTISTQGLLSGMPSTKASTSFEISAKNTRASGQKIYTLVVGDSYFQATSIATGVEHTCAVSVNGGAYCWGRNSSGQLGNGNTVSQNKPTPVVGLSSGVIAVAAAGNHSCAIKQGGALVCWGGNDWGYLGDNTKSQRLTPIDVIGMGADVTSVSTGHAHTCAIKSGGSAWCWGYGGDGRLGAGNLNSISVPVQVSIGNDAKKIVAGFAHTCAITLGGAAKCWGPSNDGKLGDGTTPNKSVPTQVFGLESGVTDITASENHSCAIVNGEAYCWGKNSSGQLGDGSTDSLKLYPTKVIGLTTSVAITSRKDSTCVINSDSTASCWGVNDSGQLGDGTMSARSIPAKIPNLSGVASISSGNYHGCLILSNGGAQCFGRNNYGQVGDSSTVVKTNPAKVTDSL